MVVSVLRIGPLPSEHTELLLASIENHLQVVDGDGDQQQQQSSQQQQTLRLDNKYFTANVRVVDIEHELSPSSSKEDDAGTRDDGVLLVFDSQSASAFDAVASLHMLHEQELGDLLRLCVGASSSSSSNATDDDKEYSRRVLWCLDHGYEYVEADLSADGVSRGHEERDKEGFARIIEAMEGTVWSSAVMKTKRGQQVVQTYQQQCAENDHQKAASSMASEYIPPVVVSPIITCEEDQDRELRARQALLPSSNDAATPTSYTIEDEHKNDGNVAVIPEHTRIEKDEERTIDAMEHTIQEAKRIRESSRSGELSNDERQRRAGDAAALLMNLMGQMGMDDDSEDDAEE